jgi:iron complex outermembrane receptor protein
MKRLLAAAIWLWVMPSWGQAQPAAADASAGGLEEIVVTAQRRVEDVQRVPAPITVLSADVVRDAGVTQPQHLTYLVTGLQVGSLPGPSALLYMRGVGNFAGNALQDPTITFNFDGAYIARQTAAGGLYYDLERVEVLKGPQGTLYGRNATGGAVNVLPRRPELEVLDGEVSAEYGEYDSVRIDGVLNAPLGDRTALRVAGQRTRHDAFMNDGTDDQDDWAGRLSFQRQANDDLAIRMVADYYDQGGHGPGSTPLALDPDNRSGVTSPEGGAYYQTQPAAGAGRNFAPVPATQYANDRHSGVSATIDWRTALGELTLLPAYRESHLDLDNTTSGNVITLQEQSRQSSVEARLISNPGTRVHTLVGVFYFDENVDTTDDDLFRPYNGFNLSLQRPQSGVESAAIFGRVTWDATDDLRATFGARYTREEKFLRGSFESFNRLCPPVPTASCPNSQPFPPDTTTSPLVFPPGASNAVPVFNPADGSLTVGFRILSDETATFSHPTYRAALEYDLADRAILYGSFETGFKSGGFFFSNDSGVYEPEYVDAFTLGLKSRLLDNRLQANVEVFDWRYKDQQVSKISIDSLGATNLRTENVGRATIRGVELGLEYLPSVNTLLSANLQYLDAVYDSYTYLTPLSVGPPVSGCPVATTPSGFLIDCSGRRSPYAPEWTVALGAGQTFPLRGDASLIVQARARYQSDVLVGLDFLPAQEQDDYWIVDASLTFESAGNRYFVTLFGQNLTDETVLSNTLVVPFGRFPVGVLRPPRVLGLRAGVRF